MVTAGAGRAQDRVAQRSHDGQTDDDDDGPTTSVHRRGLTGSPRSGRASPCGVDRWERTPPPGVRRVAVTSLIAPAARRRRLNPSSRARRRSVAQRQSSEAVLPLCIVRGYGRSSHSQRAPWPRSQRCAHQPATRSAPTVALRGYI